MKILNKLMERKKDIWLKSPFVKNPTQQAFKVNTETNLWYCFETQQGGNLTDFVKALSKVNLPNQKVQTKSQWQPIDTAPRNGTVILGWYLGASFVVEMSFTPEENKFWAGIDDKYIYLDSSNFSHWMPLPPDPTESK